ncbi:hypothetical protein E1258_04565 [Micromonospora sp. KC207]|uniref:Tn3 family transposase n=1 Tax=Micromonospora sp. KC207 TaxID=2530377 RepID=UPI0010434069|nr:Tn3 family transposase [Micromonospora sp. KC207]TDC65825.1 hypothetical protein E1258_04565 [Micromonospora sp. KC207]
MATVRWLEVQVLELMALYPDFPAAFTSASGGTSRLADLQVAVAALLTAHALNVGFGPVIAGTEASTRDRLAHVDQVVSYARISADVGRDERDAPLRYPFRWCSIVSRLRLPRCAATRGLRQVAGPGWR